MRFIWALIFTGAGFLLIKYNYIFVQFFGHISWAEQHMGGGGTYTLYKIVGVIVIIMAMLYMFGGLNFLAGPASSILPK